MQIRYAIFLSIVMLASYEIKIKGLMGFGSTPTQPDVISEAKQGTPEKPCDGGTSQCGTCQTPYADPFLPCNALFDEHVIHSLHTSKEVMECYERVFAILGQLSGITPTGSPFMCPKKVKTALANYTKMHEEELQKTS